MYPASPQMSEALRALKAWGCPFVRLTDKTWRPERFSEEPPTISCNTMLTLIKRGHVRVISHSERGTAIMVEHLDAAR